MSFYDDKLLKLQRQISEKRRLESVLQSLYLQRIELTNKVTQLEAKKFSEQKDVDRLEGRSLTSFFYNVIGKMDEMLDAERQEAYVAAVKYDAAVRELESVNYDIKQYEDEQLALTGCESEYASLLKEKAQLIKNSGSSAAEDILTLENRITELESQKKEINEAIVAGNSALATANSILTSLDSAGSWATWDVLGGGLISDLAKHEHLDAAQSLVETLQIQLRRFRTELADTTIDAYIEVRIDDFMRFADFFFDGLFADWTVKNRITESQNQVGGTVSKIETVLSKLAAMLDTADKDQQKAKAELDEIIKNAKL